MAVIGFIHQSDERVQLSDYACQQYFQSNDFTLFIKKLKTKDTVIIPELATIQKSTRQLGKIVPKLIEKQIRLIAVKENIDTEVDKHFYSHILALAELDRAITKNRIKTGINRAKKANRIGGRPKIEPRIIEKINDYYHKRRYTIQMTADKLNISVGTVYKYLKK
ncbi:MULTISPECIES: recombinase family protein [unclassified Enterococcus]|uniref:recombinase family protein n=1 Tax=unclassified Enterococcus TaxID=2608891 RepID=UPI001551F210|nr:MULTISPECIES: recombinase family protein [unclassified Enterococcus]MBS7576793.1 recombinase family protein [Enterococcus sp. MMGLQ5-2]MBS7584200.1 recombinase family protein [Enterococcus sp. MMGLQ5-1]NPD12058.1 recombinase family protein [Enterococcus sp. MMGLQ5-1]NPD36630.1 recombinase family protein [Enterococcus sp. MMGLQ5-2]